MASNTHIDHLVAEARAGRNPCIVCRMPSGWAALNNQQYLSGYCILLPDPVVETINDLDPLGRAQFLSDMVAIGDALLEVTGSFRINYGILGNSAPALHAHIVPRYLSEPEELRKGPPWSYPPDLAMVRPFNAQSDRDLMEKLASSIRKKLDV
jgi:diadenosine tetraphosphate (Ap4A) HIT family hydrolase